MGRPAEDSEAQRGPASQAHAGRRSHSPPGHMQQGMHYGTRDSWLGRLPMLPGLGSAAGGNPAQAGEGGKTAAAQQVARLLGYA